MANIGQFLFTLFVVFPLMWALGSCGTILLAQGIGEWWTDDFKREYINGKVIFGAFITICWIIALVKLSH